ncbi:MAG: DUF3592 domain-containing protein [Clostridia bacterium]|nr:DUF3592 domain-containing protein [Clostridia bacterium]
MFSLKGIPVKIIAAVLAVIALAAGVYLTFFHSVGFVKTQATIVDLRDSTTDGSTTYYPTAEYTVDGVTYTKELDVASGSYKMGQVISVLYDPNDPAVAHSDSFLGVYFLGVGVVILAVIIVSEVKKKKALGQVKTVQAENGGNTYPASVPGPESWLYFLTDLGTTKAGHRIEDASRNVLYEAKMTKFTLTAPFGFDFIDHEHGKTTPHLIGHEEASDWGNSLLFDNHYTFTFDGEDIWKHLKRNGITVDSSLTGAARTEYIIKRNGQEIATAVSSSQNVHEEDEEAKSKLASLIPVQGFYRIRTTETDLSLLFVTLLAFARSGASDDRGGNRKTLMNTLKKI